MKQWTVAIKYQAYHLYVVDNIITYSERDKVIKMVLGQLDTYLNLVEKQYHDDYETGREPWHHKIEDGYLWFKIGDGEYERLNSDGKISEIKDRLEKKGHCSIVDDILVVFETPTDMLSPGAKARYICDL